MSRTSGAGTDALERAQGSRGFRALACGGFAATGVLHVLIGIIAIGIGTGGGPTGGGGQASQSGALQQLASAPGGLVLVWIVAVGLVALGVWQVVKGLLVRETDTRQRWFARIKEFGQAVGYLAIAVLAIGVAVRGGSSGGGGTQGITGRVLQVPGGVVLLVLVGLGILAGGVYFGQKGIRRKFLDDLSLPGGAIRRAVTVIGVVGFLAKGVALAVFGVLFVVAAVTTDPQKANGLDSAFRELAALPFGVALLVAVGIGFVAYGVYCGFRARYAKL